MPMTMRHLASGDRYDSMKFNFRVPHNTISVCVCEVCLAITEEYIAWGAGGREHSASSCGDCRILGTAEPLLAQACLWTSCPSPFCWHAYCIRANKKLVKRYECTVLTVSQVRQQRSAIAARAQCKSRDTSMSAVQAP